MKSQIEKIQAQELEELTEKWRAQEKVKVAMANNFVAEQQIIEEKPKLMYEYNKAESDYKNYFNQLRERYGKNISINLGDGTITYI